MHNYHALLKEIRDEGHTKADRTGTGTISLFGPQLRFDLQKGFPLVTTKKVHLRSIIHELLWFLNGDTNVKYLNDNGVSIWDEWANELGNLGPVYGKQWREWDDTKITPAADVAMANHLKGKGYTLVGHTPHPGNGPALSIWQKSHDQISKAIDQLRNDPDNRRIIVSAWNVGELDQMALAPCHAFFQFYTRELSTDERLDWLQDNDSEQFGKPCFSNEAVYLDSVMHNELDAYSVPRRVLSCQLYQRSADMFLGVPFNIASYALLIHMVAQQVNMMPGEFVWTAGDAHIYTNHLEQVKEQLSREPRSLPTLTLKRKPDSIFDYKFEDFVLSGYDPHPAIKAPVAI